MAQQTKGSAVLFIGLLFAAAAAAAQAESVEMIYSIDGGLAPGWRDVSWNGMYDIHYRADMMMGGEGMQQQQQQQNIVQQPLREEKSGTPSNFPSPYGEDMAYYEDSTAYGVTDTMRAIYASPSAYGGLSLHAPMPLNASSVSFYINIVPGGDPSALLHPATVRFRFRFRFRFRLQVAFAYAVLPLPLPRGQRGRLGLLARP